METPVTNRLAVVTVLPPPLTGQTFVSQEICSRLANLKECDLYLIRNSCGHTGVRWTLRKHGSIVSIFFRLAFSRRQRQRGYFVPDAGAGLWFNILEALLMRLVFEKVWFHHHTFSYVRNADARMRAIHLILGGRLHHVALGDSMAHGLRRHYSSRQVTVLGNAPFVCNTPAAHARRSLDTIGFLGNITQNKGIKLFMQTAERAMIAAPDLCCRIAGPIHDRLLRTDVEAFCAVDPARRQWLGPVYGADKAKFFHGIDVLLFPSLYAHEAMPLTIYEALASGVPVLATSRGCVPDQLGGLGWDFSDEVFANAAARQLQGWVADPTSFAAASRIAAAHFSDHYVAQSLVLDAFIRKLIS